MTKTDSIIEADKPYVLGKRLVIKQFQIKKEKRGFQNELKILKKIKSLALKNNGGFPVIISAKLSSSTGEIMMSYVGKDIFEIYSIDRGLNDPTKHRALTVSELSTLGMQIISQLEILHRLGYTHNDLKFQNICFNQETKLFSLIDFALVTKIFNANGNHKQQEKLKSFYGNSLFAPDSMIKLMSTGRKDDIESFIYILCYLYQGNLPVVQFINENIEDLNMSQFLEKILEFRNQHRDICHEKVKSYLPQHFAPAFAYIISL